MAHEGRRVADDEHIIGRMLRLGWLGRELDKGGKGQKGETTWQLPSIPR